MISPNRLDLPLGITGGYGLINDTQLVRLTWENQSDLYSAYAYQYKWENSKQGWLVVYRDLYPLATRGLYIMGNIKTLLQNFIHKRNYCLPILRTAAKHGNSTLTRLTTP